MAIDKKGHSLGKQRSTTGKAAKDGDAPKAASKPQKSWRLRVQQAPEPLVLPKKTKKAEGEGEGEGKGAEKGGVKKRKAEEETTDEVESPKKTKAKKGEKKDKAVAVVEPTSSSAVATPSSSSSKPSSSSSKPSSTRRASSSSSKKASAPAASEEAVLSGLDPAAYHSSSEGEDSSDDDDDESDLDMDSGPVEGIELSKLPTVDKSDKTVQAKLAKAKKSADKEKGVLYLGRIPHGFYEVQMKAYFEQFGDVEKVRLARNKKTGKSKHYAFLLMNSLSVAKIVAETMDNYLLLGHILRCKVIPNDEVHPSLWVGANRKWRAVPSVRLERAKLEQPRTAAQQARAEGRLLSRQAAKQAKLASLGIDYDLAPVGFKKVAA